MTSETEAPRARPKPFETGSAPGFHELPTVQERERERQRERESEGERERERERERARARARARARERDCSMRSPE